jgi:hypothetical protein
MHRFEELLGFLNQDQKNCITGTPLLARIFLELSLIDFAHGSALALRLASRNRRLFEVHRL